MILKTSNFQSKWETSRKSKKSIALALAFLVMKITKNIQSMYQKYVVKKKTCWLIIDRGRNKKHYVLINDFNRFVYDHSLYRRRKYFCRYCLQAFIREKILKIILKVALKLMTNKQLRCLRKVNMLNLKILKEK